MVDKNILINLHIIFVLIRSDIKCKEVRPMLKLILTAINNLENNNELIENIDKNKLLRDKYLKLLVVGNNRTAVNYDTEIIKRILASAINEITCLCGKNEYEQAYALVDAVHVFPEIDFDSKESLADYWNVYVVPFNKKWHNNCFAEYKAFFV